MFVLDTKNLRGYDYLILNEVISLENSKFENSNIDNLRKRLLVKKHSKWNMCIKEELLNNILHSLQYKGYLHISNDCAKCNVKEIEMLFYQFKKIREASRLLVWEQISEIDYEIYVAVLLCKLWDRELNINNIKEITGQNFCVIGDSLNNLHDVDLLEVCKSKGE